MAAKWEATGKIAKQAEMSGGWNGGQSAERWGVIRFRGFGGTT